MVQQSAFRDAFRFISFITMSIMKAVDTLFNAITDNRSSWIRLRRKRHTGSIGVLLYLAGSNHDSTLFDQAPNRVVTRSTCLHIQPNHHLFFNHVPNALATWGIYCHVFIETYVDRVANRAAFVAKKDVIFSEKLASFDTQALENYIKYFNSYPKWHCINS